ncbi:MAG: sodium/proline symporter [Phycisphaerales bacterium]|nr:sodium/proline symporter [Phycisphaerales bacterium]
MTVFAISFIVYSAVIVMIGIAAGRNAGKDDESYFLGKRKLGPWVAALSASASSESGWVTIGLVGWAFTSGSSAYWILPGGLIGYLFNWVVIAGPLRAQSERLGAITVPDYLSMRFGEGRGGRLPVVRIISVIVILLAMWMYVAAQFAAAGKAFEAAFGMDYTWGLVIGACIVLVYTVVGGFKAACWTDFAQAIVMFIALVIFPFWALSQVGWWSGLSETLGTVDDGALTTFWPQETGFALVGFLLGSGALGINFGYLGQPHVLIRFLAMRSRRDAVPGAIIAFTWGALVLWGAVTVGLIARAMTIDGAEWAQPLVDSSGETGLVLAAQGMLPGLLSGMVLAAILAAICSTADSQLVVAASAVASDIYARLVRKEGAGAWINRLTVLALGVAAVALVLNPDVKVFDFVLTYGWAVLGACFGPQILLALFWGRASRAGAVAGLLVGLVVALGWKMGMNNLVELTVNGEQQKIEVYNLPLAFCAALLANVLISLVLPDREAATMGNSNGA